MRRKLIDVTTFRLSNMEIFAEDYCPNLRASELSSESVHALVLFRSFGKCEANFSAEFMQVFPQRFGAVMNTTR